jgi:hypothetical protein
MPKILEAQSLQLQLQRASRQRELLQLDIYQTCATIHGRIIQSSFHIIVEHVDTTFARARRQRLNLESTL